jgi:hypothetical protein
LAKRYDNKKAPFFGRGLLLGVALGLLEEMCVGIEVV